MFSDTVFPGLPEPEPRPSTTLWPEHHEVAVKARTVTDERSGAARTATGIEYAKCKSAFQ